MGTSDEFKVARLILMSSVMILEIKAKLFALPLLIKANNLSHTTEKKSTKINNVMLLELLLV